jgi:hypothetical protein
MQMRLLRLSLDKSLGCCSQSLEKREIYFSTRGGREMIYKLPKRRIYA